MCSIFMNVLTRRKVNRKMAGIPSAFNNYLLHECWRILDQTLITSKLFLQLSFLRWLNTVLLKNDSFTKPQNSSTNFYSLILC